MKRQVLLLFVVVALAAACTPAPPPALPDTTAADTAAINKLRDDYAAAWKAADAERLGRLVTTDVTFYPVNQPTVSGRDALVSFYKNEFAGFTPNDFVIRSAEMKLAGNWAVDRGTVDIALTPKVPAGVPLMKLQGRFVVVLQKQSDGSWLLRTGIDNAAAPMPPPPPGK